MKATPTSLLLSALLAVASVGTTSAQDLTIDLLQKGNAVNDAMYGIFFEEINHAGDGGLYAEMVQNRGFEEHVLPVGMTYNNGTIRAVESAHYGTGRIARWRAEWNLEEKIMQGWRVESDCAEAKVEEPDVPLHANTPNALSIRFDAPGTATIANTGYWGMAFTKGAKYDLRLYVRTPSEGLSGQLRVQLYDTETATVVAELPARALETNGEWTEVTATLEASATATKGELRLVVEATGAGTVQLDYVSLFPQDTFKGRPGGLRPDIAQLLADLHPAFMRWPGGCIVEGVGLDCRVKWKETLGDPMTRRGEWSLWGYRSTYGLGYHEFLQFCEDLGMDGMFVTNVGMGCGARNGDYIDTPEELALFLQDIRDAIEYAIGDPATNEWAALRRDAGHAEPFPLKYVELGNENGGDIYVRHFNYMYQTLKAEYPQITFICTLGGTEKEMADVEQTDMVDPHWYVEPTFFFSSNDLFDTRERAGYTVYVGEYACNVGVESGNMLATLSEAAFMLGMERNGDLVQMASYAPLLTNVNAPNWQCNLIWFDSSRSMGRASYYLQQMMADNRPDYNLSLNEVASQPEQQLLTAGTVGLAGGMGGQAKYRNLRLTTNGTTRTISPESLTTEGEGWRVEGDELVQQAQQRGQGGPGQGGPGGRPGQGAMALLKGESLSSYTLELQACLLPNEREEGMTRQQRPGLGDALEGGAPEGEGPEGERPEGDGPEGEGPDGDGPRGRRGGGGFTLLFGMDEEGRTGYAFNIGSWGGRVMAMQMREGRPAMMSSRDTTLTLQADRWYDLKIEVNEEHALLYVDGELLSEASLQSYPKQFFAAGYDTECGEVVVKVVNADTQPYTMGLSLEGAKQVASTGTVCTLKADAATDENTLDDPLRITPVRSTFDQFASQFDYTFDPLSITILRVKAQ